MAVGLHLKDQYCIRVKCMFMRVCILYAQRQIKMNCRSRGNISAYDFFNDAVARVPEIACVVSTKNKAEAARHADCVKVLSSGTIFFYYV